jgi:hypothetical protein
MAKFGSLSGSAEEPFRVVLLDPSTDQPIVDVNGQSAYVDVLCAQSDAGREYDRERNSAQLRKAARGRASFDDDLFEANVAKLSRLTVGWHLVDPVNRAPLDVPCSEENSAEFYRQKLCYSFFQQVFAAAHDTGNFLMRSSKSSSSSSSMTLGSAQS